MSEDDAPWALVADDDPVSAKLLRVILQSEGYRVTCVANGRMALAALAAMPRPHLILTDYQMPEMNGAELIEALESDPRYAGIPVVLVSASPEAALVGSFAFLAKPAPLAELQKLARRAAVAGSAWKAAAPASPEACAEGAATEAKAEAAADEAAAAGLKGGTGS